MKFVQRDVRHTGKGAHETVWNRATPSFRSICLIEESGGGWKRHTLYTEVSASVYQSGAAESSFSVPTEPLNSANRQSYTTQHGRDTHIKNRYRSRHV